MSFYAKQFGGIFSGGGGGGGGTPVQEAPTGAVDGVNVTFTLSQVPAANASVDLSLDGVTQRQGGGLEYTLSGTTITMATAPLAVPIPQTLWALYDA